MSENIIQPGFLESIRARCDRYAKYAAVFAGFGITLSTSLTALSYLFVALFWLGSGNWRQKFEAIRHNTVVLAALALFVLFIVGLSYTSSPPDHAVARVGAYLNSLLFVAIFATIVQDDEKLRLQILLAFLAGMALTLFLFIADLGGLVPYVDIRGKGGTVFYAYLETNYFMAIATYFGFIFLLQNYKSWSGPRVWFAILVLTAAMVTIFFYSNGRTGYIAVVAMLATFFLVRYRVRGVLIGLVAITVLIGIAYSTSETFKGRMQSVITEINHPNILETETSTGIRYRFYYYGIRMIAANPLLGTGTGSVDTEYPKYDKLYRGDGVNLHSEYLTIAGELGLVGLVLMLGMLALAVKRAFLLDETQKYLALGFLAAFASASLVNSFLLDANVGHFFAMMIGTLLSGSVRVGSTNRD